MLEKKRLDIPLARSAVAFNTESIQEDLWVIKISESSV